MPDYDCDICGACCVHFSIDVTEEDMRREPALREAVRRLPLSMLTTHGVLDDRPGHYLNHDNYSSCPFLDSTGACGVHSTKPTVCANFQPGNPYCQWARDRSGLALLYPRISNKEK